MKHQKLYTAVAIVLFVVLLVCSTLGLEHLLKDKNNYIKYNQFYEETENFDVLFFGSSRVLDGIMPIQLWDDYGIRGYNMAQHGENVLISYWQLKNALQYQTPKVVFFDISLFAAEIVTPESEKETQAYLHKSLDHMPLSLTKIRAVEALTEGFTVNEYLFPLTMYHNRWNELTAQDFYEAEPAFKGAEDRVTLEVESDADWGGDEALDRETFDPDRLYLDKVIEMCREKDIEIVITCMPAVNMKLQTYFYPAINSFEEYCDEYGVTFLNFCRDDAFLNNQTDYADGAHLNPSGSRKLTSEIGAYLTETYTFDAEASARVQEQWDTAYENYRLTRLAEIRNCAATQDIYGYMMLVSGTKEFDVRVSVPSKDYIQIEDVKTYLEELGHPLSEASVDESLAGVTFTLIDARDGSVIEEHTFGL